MPSAIDSQSERHTGRAHSTAEPAWDADSCEGEEGTPEEDSEVGMPVGSVSAGVAHRTSRMARARSGGGSPRDGSGLVVTIQPSTQLSEDAHLPSDLTSDRCHPRSAALSAGGAALSTVDRAAASGLSRAGSLPPTLAQRDAADQPLDAASGTMTRKASAVVDEIFIVDFVSELFPDAFTPEELPELIGRFSQDDGHVRLSTLRGAIDAVIYDANLAIEDALMESSMDAAGDAGRLGSMHAMQIRQQARIAFQPEAKKKSQKALKVGAKAPNGAPPLQKQDTRTSVRECQGSFIEASMMGAYSLIDSAPPALRGASQPSDESGAAPAPATQLTLERVSESSEQKRVRLVDDIGETRLATWQMLYCGGSQPVVDALEKIKKKLGISLKVEKFDW